MIYNNNALFQKLKSALWNEVKYGFILTEGIDSIKNIDTYDKYVKMKVGESITLYDFLMIFKNEYNNINSDVKNEMYRLYFQLLTACHALVLSGVNHNDLHFGNVWIKKVNPCTNEYLINDNLYKLNVTHTVLIYDFDRAYLSDYTNIFSNHINSALISVNCKDMLQLFSYLYYIDDFPKDICIDNTPVTGLQRLIINTTMKPTSNITTLTTILGDCHNPLRKNHITERLNVPVPIPDPDLDPNNPKPDQKYPFNSLYEMLNKWYMANNGIMYTPPKIPIDTKVYVCNKNNFKSYNINTQNIYQDLNKLKQENNKLKQENNNLKDKIGYMID